MSSQFSTARRQLSTSSSSTLGQDVSSAMKASPRLKLAIFPSYSSSTTATNGSSGCYEYMPFSSTRNATSAEHPPAPPPSPIDFPSSAMPSWYLSREQ
ncbi:MAG: hexokinase A [Chaenotheca gracillima]|nr:MAG: hexokinase A [Chaenotheca gracillima]